MLEDKVAGRSPAPEPKKSTRPSNVIDLVDILQQSLRSSGKGATDKGSSSHASSKSKAKHTHTAPKRRKAA
jgi:non-homologous end joining protein Ku